MPSWRYMNEEAIREELDAMKDTRPTAKWEVRFSEYFSEDMYYYRTASEKRIRAFAREKSKTCSHRRAMVFHNHQIVSVYLLGDRFDYVSPNVERVLT